MSFFIPENKNELQIAVDLWCKDKEQALLKYGNISKWDTHLITDMSELFKGIERRVPINIYCEEISLFFVSKLPSARFLKFNANPIVFSHISKFFVST